MLSRAALKFYAVLLLCKGQLLLEVAVNGMGMDVRFCGGGYYLERNIYGAHNICQMPTMIPW